MRQVLALALLVGAMLGLAKLGTWLTGSAIDEQLRTFVELGITFAGVGFVVLTAYVLAAAGAGFKPLPLPRVTGYILAGIALGPYASEVLSKDVVHDLENFNKLALSLIALEAGLELQMTAIKKVARSLLSIVAFKVPLSWLLIGGAFYLASPLLPMELSSAERLTIGLVIGALAVGTSPAVSVAVISERQSKGKTPDLILSIAVFKDIVMILMLAVAITVGQSLVTGSEMSADSFVKLGKKISLSILAGAVLGGLLIAFMRWVRWQLVLTLLIVAYGGAVLSDVLHLKSLLVFIAAGFVVSNFSHYGHDLHKPLALLALPIFIVFFTRAGAGLDLSATVAVLPVAAILFVVRLFMLFSATKLGAKIAKDPPEFSNNVWLGFVSQAGVALGLLLIAQKDLEVLAVPLGQVGVSLIALNLLIGPILLGVALKRAAPLEQDAAAGAPDPHADPHAPADPALAPDAAEVTEDEDADAPALLTATEDDAEEEADAPDYGPGPEDEALTTVHARLSEHLDEICVDLERDVLGAWQEQVDIRLEALEGEPPNDPGTIHAALQPVDLEPAARWLREAVREVRDRLAQLPGKLQRPMLPHHKGLSGDAGLRQRTAHRWQSLTGRGKRAVALRLVSRTYIEGTFVCGLERSLQTLAAMEAERIEALHQAFQAALVAHRADGEPGSAWEEPVLDVAQLRKGVEASVALWVRELNRYKVEALGQLGAALRHAGTADASGKHRYEKVAMAVDTAVKALDSDGPKWNRALAAAAGRARLSAVLEELETGISHEMTQVVRRFTSGQQVDVSTVVDSVRSALDKSRERLVAELPNMNRLQATARLNREAAALEDVVTRDALPRIGEVRHFEQEGEGVFSAVTTTLGGTIDSLDEEWPALPIAYRWSLANRPTTPDEVPAKVLSVRSLARRYLIGELKWAYDDAGAQAERMIDRVAVRLGEVAGVITYGLRTAIKEIESSPGQQVGEVGVEVTVGSLDRALKIVDGLSAELVETVESMPDSMGSLTHDAFETLRQRTLGVHGTEAPKAGSSWERVQRNLQTFWHDLGEAYGGLRRGIVELYQSASQSAMARDARVRVGLEEVDEAAMARDVARFAVAKEQRAKLPYVLAKLFEGSALDTPQILAGAEKERLAIADAWARFLDGEPTSILVTGDSGSGKTSVAHVELRELSKRRLCEVKLHPFERSETGFCATVGAEAGCYDARDFASLAESLEELSDKIVILLDGLEQIFERTPEGLEHMRRVLRLILQTRHHVCWVVAVNSPTSRLLEHVCDLKGYFTDWVEFRPRKGEEIVELIEARARLAGFAIEWPHPQIRGFWDRLKPSAWQRDDDARRNRFSRRLFAVSGGNVRDGISVFVNAIDEVSEEVVRLNDIEAPALSWFEHLGRDAQRVLALAIITGSISRPEAIRALRWTDARLDAALGRLVGAHLLVLSNVAPGDEPGARWEVHAPVWRRVQQRLAENNLLIDPARGPSKRERQ